MQPQPTQPQQAQPVGVPLQQQAPQMAQGTPALQQTQGAPDHPQDIILVKNILENDNTEIEETIPYTSPKPGPADQISPVREQSFNEQPIKWNTRDGFQVRWDNQWFHIPPGEERLMPRYIAEHFAKHLVDFMLGQKEDKTRKRGLQQSSKERLPLLQQILKKVETKYLAGVQVTSPGEKALEQFNTLNPAQQAQQAEEDKNTLDLGNVPSPAVGVLQDDNDNDDDFKILPSDPPPQLSEQDQEKVDKIINGRSREQLFEEAHTLGIEVKGSESVEQLAILISNF